MALAAADNRLNPGDQLTFVEWFGQVIIGTNTKAADLGIRLTQAGKQQDRGINTRGTQPSEDFIAIDVGQHDVENHDVVIIDFADLQTVFPKVGMVNDKTLGPEHQRNAVGCAQIVLNQQNTHIGSPLSLLSVSL